jgi:hypothetical protein
MSIPLSQVLKAAIGQRLQTPEGKAEMQRVGDKMAFSMMEHFHRVLVETLEQAGGDTDLAYRSLLKAFERPPQ